MDSITTIEEFYDVMNESVYTRRDIVEALMRDDEPDIEDIKILKEILESLLSIPRSDGEWVLKTSDGKSIRMNLDYELRELDRDIRFLINGEESLVSEISRNDNAFLTDVRSVMDYVESSDVDNLITDRDGTINNYCDRYLSAVQSAYNSYFLCRFLRRRTRNKRKKGIIVTSAPLEGITKLSVDPGNTFIYAGSKGREFLTSRGSRREKKIDGKKKEKLDEVKTGILDLIKKSKYSKFSLIGSGFQEKFGQITIARQDISGSIAKKESEDFLKRIKKIVRDADKGEGLLDIEDTGLDIEIMVTTGSKKGFDKGDGILYIAKELGIDMKRSSTLVCGDTSSDLPMAEKISGKSKSARSIFVTKDKNLKRKVRRKVKNSIFVSTPDALVYGLHCAARKNKTKKNKK